jgi:uncharacterized membrane protein
MIQSFLKFMREALTRYFVAGVLALAPLAITLWVMLWIIKRLDNLLLPRLIDWIMPSIDRPPDLPPLVGALFTFLVILISGVIVRHLFGHELVRIGERILARVPVARSIYSGVKQLFEAILASSGSKQSFSRVVLVEYPRRGIWGIAFVTGPVRGTLEGVYAEEPMLNCFIPTTPNPTSGFYLLVPEKDTVEVAMSVEDAFKVIMSAGLVTPTPTFPEPNSGDSED